MSVLELVTCSPCTFAGEVIVTLLNAFCFLSEFWLSEEDGRREHCAKNRHSCMLGSESKLSLAREH